MPTVPWRRRLTPEPGAEHVVMDSRLPLRSLLRGAEVRGTSRLRRQAARTDGGPRRLQPAGQPLATTFWNLSAWTDVAALSRSAAEMPHRAVMTGLRPYMGATRFETWTCPGSALSVEWEEAVERLVRPAGSAPPTAAPVGATGPEVWP